MRRILNHGVWVGVVSLVLAAPAFAGTPNKLVRKTGTAASAAVSVLESNREGWVWSISLLCVTGPCYVGLYDSTSSTSGAGSVLWEGVAGTGVPYTQDFEAPLAYRNGLRLEVTGTGGRAFVAYEP